MLGASALQCDVRLEKRGARWSDRLAFLRENGWRCVNGNSFNTAVRAVARYGLSLTLKQQIPVRAKISSVGVYVPPRLLTNADLEKMVETNDKWIVERTGIRERHLVDKGVATSDLAVHAAKCCLAKRGVDAREVEVIIVATVTPD